MVLYAAPCNYQVVGILLRSPYIENDQRQAVFSRLSFQKLLDLWEDVSQIIFKSIIPFLRNRQNRTFHINAFQLLMV